MKIFEELNSLELEESAKTDFKAKFGDELFNNFEKAKDRLKNNNLSTDYGQYLNKSKEDLQQLLLSLYNKKDKNGNDIDAEKRRIIQGAQREVRGKYKFLGEFEGLLVYQPLDYISSMDLGINTGWCTTGRYTHEGHPDFTPSAEEAQKHFDDYTSKGVELYYFLDPKTFYGVYAIAKYPKTLYPKMNVFDKEHDSAVYLEYTNYELFNSDDDNLWDDNNIAVKIAGSRLGLSLLLKIDRNKTFILKGGIRYIGDYLCKCYDPSIKDVRIPYGTTSIGEDAFADCNILRSISIPDSVTNIGGGAFYNCSNLTDITIPNSVKDIGVDAFYKCSKVTVYTNNPYVIEYCKYNNIKYDNNIKEGLDMSLLESKEDWDRFKTWLMQKVSEEDADKYIKHFKQFKNDFNEKDIYNIMKDSQNRFIYDVKRDINLKKNKEEVRKRKSGGKELIYSNSTWDVYKVTTYEASRELGGDTSWCISSSDKWYFDDYTGGGSSFYFYLNKVTGEKFALECNDNGSYEIYNMDDSVIPYIPNGPKVNGLPDVTDYSPAFIDELLRALSTYGIKKEDIGMIYISSPGGNPLECDEFYTVDLGREIDGHEYLYVMRDFDSGGQLVDVTYEVEEVESEDYDESLEPSKLNASKGLKEDMEDNNQKVAYDITVYDRDGDLDYEDVFYFDKSNVEKSTQELKEYVDFLIKDIYYYVTVEDSETGELIMTDEKEAPENDTMSIQELIPKITEQNFIEQAQKMGLIIPSSKKGNLMFITPNGTVINLGDKYDTHIEGATAIFNAMFGTNYDVYYEEDELKDVLIYLEEKLSFITLNRAKNLDNRLKIVCWNQPSKYQYFEIEDFVDSITDWQGEILLGLKLYGGGRYKLSEYDGKGIVNIIKKKFTTGIWEKLNMKESKEVGKLLEDELKTLNNKEKYEYDLYAYWSDDEDIYYGDYAHIPEGCLKAEVVSFNVYEEDNLVCVGLSDRNKEFQDYYDQHGNIGRKTESLGINEADEVIADYTDNKPSTVAKFIKDEAEFLKENDDYEGSYLKLDDKYAVVVAWEDGFDEEDTDVIHSSSTPSWGLCVGIREINPNDSCAYWDFPYDKTTQEVIADSTSIEPDLDTEEYLGLAKWVLGEYKTVKDTKDVEDKDSEDDIEESLNEHYVYIKKGDVVEAEGDGEVIVINPDCGHGYYWGTDNLSNFESETGGSYLKSDVVDIIGRVVEDDDGELEIEYYDDYDDDYEDDYDEE